MKIILKDVTHSFASDITGSFDALKKINCSIDKHDFIGLIGPTGSGKTTLIEHLNGLLIPSKGELHFDYTFEKMNKKTGAIEKIERNRVVKKSWRKIKNVKEIRKSIGIVFQFAEYQLFEETIEKDIIFGPINMGIPKEKAKEIAKDIIKKVGLPEEYLQRSPFELSGGQKRRVALAGILAMQPSILVFDEPTAGLDPEGAHSMLELFKTIHEQGTTIIIVTHNLDDVLEFTNRTLLLKKGELIKDGDTLDVLSDINFLVKNNMAPPKLISIIDEINKRHGTNLNYVKTMKELVEQINSIKQSKINNKGGE